MIPAVSPSHLIGFALVAYALIVIPGPSVLFSVGRSLSLGRRAGLLSVLGNTAGTAVFVAPATAGLGALLTASSWALTAVKLVGAAYLIYLGVQAIRNRKSLNEALNADRPAAGQRHVFRQGFIVGLTNPKTALFFAAVLPQFADPAAGSVPTQIFLFGIVFTLIEGPSLGWAAPQLIVVLITALAAFAVFLRYESRRRHPFIDLRFFRSIPFASATLTAICACVAWSAFLFTMSLYLQGERHFSAMHTGLVYLPIAVGALVFSPISGRMVGRFGARPSLLAAGALFFTASLLLTRVTTATPIWELLVVFAIFGAGFSMVNAPITNAAVSGMPLDRAGAASAVTSTSRQVGVSIGVALCGSIGAPALWFMCAGLGLAIATLGIVSTSPFALRSAQRLAPLIESTASREVSRVG